MIHYNVISFDANPSNDEGLAYVYFDLEEYKYITICFSEDEQDEIYIEFSEQNKSTYNDNVKYKFINEKKLEFSFGDDIVKEIGIDKNIVLDIDFNENHILDLEKTLEEIFKHKKTSRIRGEA